MSHLFSSSTSLLSQPSGPPTPSMLPKLMLSRSWDLRFTSFMTTTSSSHKFSTQQILANYRVRKVSRPKKCVSNRDGPDICFYSRIPETRYGTVTIKRFPPRKFWQPRACGLEIILTFIRSRGCFLAVNDIELCRPAFHYRTSIRKFSSGKDMIFLNRVRLSLKTGFGSVLNKSFKKILDRQPIL